MPMAARSGTHGQSVRSVQVDAPCPATLKRTGRSQAERVEVKEYGAGRFTFIERGKEVQIFGMRVERMAVNRSSGTTGGTDAPRPKPRIDIAALERQPDLTSSQRASIARYKSARKRYDAFVDEELRPGRDHLDAATGTRREQLLLRLRQRKDQEQPLKRDLDSAEASLLRAFPKGIPSEEQPGATSNAAVLPPPTEKVLLLDTSPLEATPGLTQEQSSALRAYNSAKRNYENARTPGRDVTKALADAQDGLLRAFPDLQIEIR